MAKNNPSNPDNPFAALDKKQFPDKREPKRPKPAKVKKSEPESDADARLFEQAMRPVKSHRDKNRDYRAELEDENLAAAFQKAVDGKTKPATPAPLPRPVTVEAPEPPAAAPEEADAEPDALFAAVGDSRPLPGKGREVAPETVPVEAPPPPAQNPLQDILDGKVEFALNASDEFVEGHVLGLDLLTVAKLQARQYSPEAHIDLHGLNSEQAYANLVHFFRASYHKGARTLLVVTGRGKNSLNNVPILRNKIQEWLMQEPFRRVVLAFCTAKSEDGGPGALYVLLRKQRKNSGKVRWDSSPVDPDILL